MKKVTITANWDGYNGRRYGSPWIARISAFNGAATLDFIKGAYNGNDDGGEIVAEMEVGEIFKMGQKDFRSNNSANYFYKALEGGGYECFGSPQEARKLWNEWQQSR